MNPTLHDFEKDPFLQFQDWYLQSQGKKATEKGFTGWVLRWISPLLRWVFSMIIPAMDRFEFNAVTLATCNANKEPSARVVLLKSYDENGYVFYTNYNSRKGKELEENPNAAMLFYWSYPPRQVRIRGRVEKLSREENILYWNSRPRGSQISGAASMQSHSMAAREDFFEQMRNVEMDANGGDIECPENWGGYRLIAEEYEFWQAQANRNHIRVSYRKATEVTWSKTWLQP